MKQNRKKIIRIVMVAACTAITASLSQISIPLPSGVPITLQTFAIALCGYLLGMKMGLLSTGLYIAMGAIGLPVFAGFSGSIYSLVGMTGGFIWGFLLLALLCGMGMQTGSKIPAVLLGLVGLLCCHLLGVLQFSLVTARPFADSALLVSLPYMVKDVVSVVLAYGFAAAIGFGLRKASLSIFPHPRDPKAHLQ